MKTNDWEKEYSDFILQICGGHDPFCSVRRHFTDDSCDCYVREDLKWLKAHDQRVRQQLIDEVVEKLGEIETINHTSQDIETHAWSSYGVIKKDDIITLLQKITNSK